MHMENRPANQNGNSFGRVLSVKAAYWHTFGLQELANAKGNILENKELLDSLNQTKQNSVTIGQSLDESVKLQTSLDAVSSSVTLLSVVVTLLLIHHCFLLSSRLLNNEAFCYLTLVAFLVLVHVIFNFVSSLPVRVSSSLWHVNI